MHCFLCWLVPCRTSRSKMLWEHVHSRNSLFATVKPCNRIIAIFLGSVLACFADTKEPTKDWHLVALLSDSSSLSASDSVAMESYIRAIRLWLRVSQDISVEKTYAEAKNIVANRTADDVARIAELIVRLDNNRELAAALEMDSLTIRRLLNDSPPSGKLSEPDMVELAESDAYVLLCLKKRSVGKLPKLKFREEKQHSTTVAP